MSNSVMINVDKLSKDYGTGRRAVDSISFEVRRGEVLGFLGPNGAGKTTTMKMLTSFLAPTGGRAQIAGFDVFAESVEVRRKIGYLPEDTPLYKDMTVLEYLEYCCDLRNLPRDRARLKKVADQCGIADRAGNLIGELSKGFRQRVGLAQAILHEPEVLILDEPTSGLDPNQIVEIREVIKNIGKEKTVIFSTHILQEVQATCSRVVIIADGKLVADGTPEELSRRTSGNAEIVVEVLSSVPTNDPQIVLRRVDGVEDVRAVPAQNGNRGSLFKVVAKAGADPRGAIAKMIVNTDGMELLALSQEKASLEDVFRKLTTSQGA